MTGQAIINAHNDESYSNFKANVKAVVFLGTPHRGANLAAMLSKLLTATLSRRIFVDQLNPKSSMIKQINDQFRDRAKELQLRSFYESLGMQGLGVFSSTFISNLLGHCSSRFCHLRSFWRDARTAKWESCGYCKIHIC